MNYPALRIILKCGSIVFGETRDDLTWSMRMIGITVFALAGNMWNNAAQSSDARVGNVAKVMCISATALGALTLMIPAELTWFTYLYAAVGFGFGVAYVVGMMRGSRSS
jgi:Ca2+/H+ antiporter